MKRLIAVLWLLSSVTFLWAEEEPKNVFLASNPDYRTRAGTFYEREYLPKAVQGLVAAFAPEVLPEETARKVLRDFIYEFLDQYVRDGGEITRRGHAKVLAGLDARIRELADDPRVLDNYEAWKTGGKPEFPNPIAFSTVLRFQSPPVTLELSAELTDKGWSVRSLESLDETGKYADVLGVEPYQAFVLERKGGGAGPSRSLTLLLYRSRDASRLLTALDGLAKAKPDEESRKRIPQLFWRTARHVVFLLEPSPGEDDDPLKQWIRRVWVSL